MVQAFAPFMSVFSLPKTDPPMEEPGKLHLTSENVEGKTEPGTR